MFLYNNRTRFYVNVTGVSPHLTFSILRTGEIWDVTFIPKRYFEQSFRETLPVSFFHGNKRIPDMVIQVISMSRLKLNQHGLIVPLQSCCEWALKERKGVLERTGAVFGRGESPFCHLLTSPKHTSSQFKHACLVIVIQVAMVLHGKDKTPTCVRSTLDARLLCFETFKLGGGGVRLCADWNRGGWGERSVALSDVEETMRCLWRVLLGRFGFT